MHCDSPIRNAVDHTPAYSHWSTPCYGANVSSARDAWLQLCATSLVEPTCQSCKLISPLALISNTALMHPCQLPCWFPHGLIVTFILVHIDLTEVHFDRWLIDEQLSQALVATYLESFAICMQLCDGLPFPSLLSTQCSQDRPWSYHDPG